ncbi:MAG: alanine--tRNA ligase-related protein, partial [Actinoplanes sp.]
HEDDVRMRVIADHVRSGMMLIGDGVTPGNEGRGYVLRRLLRRAVRSMRLLGIEDRVLPELMPVSRDKMGESYSSLHTDWERISTIAYAEEDAFRQTLKAGTQIFDLATSTVKKEGGVTLSGERAFALHDTYGFPIDLTLEMAAEQGLEVDAAEFQRLMGEQRSRAKADAKAKKGQHRDAAAYREVADTLGRPVEFTGYAQVTSEASVRGLVTGDGAVPRVGAGDEVELVLDRTPFYAEGGGQLADQGVIELDSGARLEVLDVQSPVTGLIVHRARVLDGEVLLGDGAVARVDVDRRRAISRAHTATHMVHKAFREALGETATQAGSENAPGRFRFDFSATGSVPASVMADVEARVNDVILDDLSVEAEVMTQAEAVASGAMALFGEKYGDRVRVVSVGDWARELCGGTHAGRSGQLGLVKILNEASIGSGVRRVEALVGIDAFGFLAKEHLLVSRLAELFRVPGDQVADRVEQTVTALRDAEKELEKMRAQLVLGGAGALAAQARDLRGVAYVGTEAPEGAATNDVRTLAQEIRGKIDSARPAVVAVAAKANGKASLIVAINAVAKSRGLSAADLVKGALSGRGGGNADLAQGGGVPADQVTVLLAAVEKAVGDAA